jgi:hypothetical protein
MPLSLSHIQSPGFTCEDIFVTSKHRTLTWCTEWSKQDRTKRLPEPLVSLKTTDLDYNPKFPSTLKGTILLSKSRGRLDSPEPPRTHSGPGSRLDYHPNYDLTCDDGGKCRFDMGRTLGRSAVLSNPTASHKGNGVTGVDVDLSPQKPATHSPSPDLAKMAGRNAGKDWTILPVFHQSALLNANYAFVDKRVLGGKWANGKRELKLAKESVIPEGYDVKYTALDKHTNGAVQLDRQPTREQYYASEERLRNITKNCDYICTRSHHWITEKPAFLGSMEHPMEVKSLLVSSEAQRKRLLASMQQICKPECRRTTKKLMSVSAVTAIPDRAKGSHQRQKGTHASSMSQPIIADITPPSRLGDLLPDDCSTPLRSPLQSRKSRSNSTSPSATRFRRDSWIRHIQ